MTKTICATLKGSAEQSGAVEQAELAPPPYRPPFRGAVRVAQERSNGGAVERGAGVARDIAALASRVERLSVSHRDPEAFWIDKGELAAELRQVARSLGVAR